MNRNLDGIYFRVMRDGKPCNICLSDMTKAEIDKVLENKRPEFLLGCIIRLAEVIKEIGDQFDIVRE